MNIFLSWEPKRPKMSVAPIDPSTTRTPYFTRQDVSVHNRDDDGWLIIHHRVLDVTALVKKSPAHLARPIWMECGSDVSHWFDSNLQLKMHVDPVSNLVQPNCPTGVFHDVPVVAPRSDVTMLGEREPWWSNAGFEIGRLTRQPRLIDVVNLLTRQRDRLLVSDEDSVAEIQERYRRNCNSHASGYVWKYLGEPVDMSKTLSENGIHFDDERMNHTGTRDDLWTPVLHLYFKDDLTDG